MSLTKISFLDFIEDHIEAVEQKIRSQVDGDNPDLKYALEHILSSGGKRIRPAVVLLVGKLLGGDSEDLVTLAASVELLHTATLVHDDLIDGALLRRGNSTLNADWSPAATVLTGDFLFSRSAYLGAELDNPEIVRDFADTLATIVRGEINQLFSRQHISDRESYFNRIYEKTASLFRLSAKGAAILSPVEKEIVSVASTYGHQLGMAFQVVDDILDFTGEQATVGKPVASDLRHGIITLPAILYQEMRPEDKSLEEVFALDVQESQIMNVVRRIQTSDAIESAYMMANEFVNQAISALENLPKGKEREVLGKLAEFVVARQI